MWSCILLDSDIPLRGRSDSNFATGKLGKERNLKFLYHHYYCVRVWKFIASTQNTYFLKLSLIYTHVLCNMHWNQIQYMVRKPALQSQHRTHKTAA